MALVMSDEFQPQSGRPFTRADLEQTPDDGRRYELLDGLLIVSAAPGRLHQRAVGRLYRILDDACPAGFEVLSNSSRLIDTHVKRERFEREGTPAYWMVDPAARPDEARLVAWELGDDGGYREVASVTGEEPFIATVPYEVTVVPADLVRERG